MGSVVGLDIGTTGVRAVESDSNGRTATVKRAHAVPLPAGVVVEGVVKDSAALVSALRDLWRKGGFRTRKAALVIGSHPAVSVRSAQVPYLPSHKDMAVVVAQQADKVMPEDPARLYLSHHVAAVEERLDDKGAATREATVAIAGADKLALDSILDAVWAAGLVPTSVDVTSFALARFLAASSSGPGAVDVLIHLGATTVTVTGILDKQFAYDLAMNQLAGEMLTQDIALSMGISPERAEALKLAGPPNPEDPFRERDLDISGQMAGFTSALAEGVVETVEGLCRSVGAPLGRVWLSGGESRLPRLAIRLAVELGARGRVAVLDGRAWVRNPEKVRAASDATGQDLTVALAASVSLGGTR
ncbi:pilus assembly protein PilM [Cellulosimicrobium sp. Marseille-Q4280]|uniref:pilus assembly protein PilM n=1 Tax=Cellulosimicrobium sp. Marseille-Q4280 TaxID=2937992 RepID=UPI0020425C33|nr:pilus assembly protein PilM [Cellulosimicrobium sp. Marseille-Q4280]